MAKSKSFFLGNDFSNLQRTRTSECHHGHSHHAKAIPSRQHFARRSLDCSRKFLVDQLGGILNGAHIVGGVEVGNLVNKGQGGR